jgi:zeaxanthin glucosyltransferase
MSHFGVICPELSGHLNPMTAVARELQRRGHRVTFYQRLTSKKRLEAAGFGYRPFAVDEFALDAIAAEQKQLAELSGLAAMNFTVNLIGRRTTACLREVPGMMREDGVDMVLVDQVCREGATIAQQLGRKHVIICNALMLNYEPDVPPFCTDWKYRPGFFRRLRNRAFDKVLQRIARPMRKPINEHRKTLGLPPLKGYLDAQLPAAEISQVPAEFDFPRTRLHATFHYTGPAIDESLREKGDFPFNKLDGRPLIYASLGTLQNRLAPVFAAIAEACQDLPLQLVLSLGGGCKLESLPKLAGSPLVVEFAPQLQLLKQAKLCITHAGLNTALESLAQAVPMVAIPITNDQPGVAARIDYTGSGRFIALKKLNVPRLKAAIETVLNEPSYAANAKRLQTAIQQTGGPRRAAEIIESALNVGQPANAPTVARA